MEEKVLCTECDKELDGWEIEHNNGICEECLLQEELADSEMGALFL